MENILIEGEFGIYKGVIYRIVSYWHDVELFSMDDIDHYYVIRKVRKDEMDDVYTLHTYCRYHGIEYIIRKIENEMVIYERSVCDKELFEKPLNELDVVFCTKNRYHQEPERIVLYMNNKFEDTIFNNLFVPEEMHNGHIMLAYQDTKMDVNDTIKTLKDLYGDRIIMHGANLEMLLVDYYIETFTIDDVNFCLDYDYGIVTINPDKENGDKYIWEITDYFNKNSIDKDHS